MARRKKNKKDESRDESAESESLDSIKKKQEKQMWKIIEKLKEVPIVYAAVSQCGIDKSTYYRWRKLWPEFAKVADEALEEGKKFVTDMARSQVVKKIKEGDKTMVIFWLKNHDPDFSDKVRHEHSHKHVLTEQMKIDIAKAAKAWSQDDKDIGEDYDAGDLMKIK